MRKALNKSRRALLHSAWQQSALWAALQAIAQTTPDPWQTHHNEWQHGVSPFTLGIASGQPRPDSVVLWTRLATEPLSPNGGMPVSPVVLRWQVSTDAAFVNVQSQGLVLAEPRLAHSVRVKVKGLLPLQTYYYRFLSGNHVSPIGTTKTSAPHGHEVATLRLALASCQHYEQGHFTVWHDIAKRTDIDAVVFLGDYLYESRAKRHLRQRAHVCVPRDLSQYRMLHAQYKSEPALQAAHAAHPWVMIWDDHEVLNDYAGDTSPDEKIDKATFIKRRKAAYQAYFEHLPFLPEQLQQHKIYDAFVWGDLVALWTLDTRQWRNPRVCAKLPRGLFGQNILPCAQTDDASRSVLGDAQTQWLSTQVTPANTRWRLLAQTTQLSPNPLRLWGNWRMRYADGWDGYPAARQQLIDIMSRTAATPWVALSADVHRHGLATLRADATNRQSSPVATEIVTSSVTSYGGSEFLGEWIRRSNPDWQHCRVDQRGYVHLTLTRTAMTICFMGTDHPVMTDSIVGTQAAFQVAHGTTRATRIKI